jgi:hypothetical protein
MPPRSRTTLPLVQPIVPVLRGVLSGLALRAASAQPRDDIRSSSARA